MIRIANHPDFVIDLPPNHRFPMEKYGLLPQQLLLEGTAEQEHFFKPKQPDDEQILTVHDKSYYHHLRNLTLGRKAERRIGFPLSKKLVERELFIVGGTVQSSVFAFDHGVSLNVSGGTHHAYTNRGEGFCMLNDQAIAAKHLQNKNLASKILIIDLDVHQGNGTAEIFYKDDSVFTFSMHGKNNYPFTKEESDLDIGLPDKTEDDFYLKTLKATLPALIEEVKPDFIFYLSGVDILATDKLGRLNCTLKGCKQRDQFVFETCYSYEIPVQCSIGGGYSKELKHIVEAHANTFRAADDVYG